MQQSRQQEMRYLQMICSMVMPNQGNIGSGGGFFAGGCGRGDTGAGSCYSGGVPSGEYYAKPDSDTRNAAVGFSSGLGCHNTNAYGCSGCGYGAGMMGQQDWNNFAAMSGYGPYPGMEGIGV